MQQNYQGNMSGLVMPGGGGNGYQDGSVNQGGSGNPGGAYNAPQTLGQRPQFNRGGQQQGLGRYRPPTMRFDGQWDDTDGYSYNLPNSFGPSERYGEFRAPARPQFRGRNSGFAGFDPRMGNRNVGNQMGRGVAFEGGGFSGPSMDGGFNGGNAIPGSFSKPFGDQFSGGGFAGGSNVGDFGTERQLSRGGFGRPLFGRAPQRVPPGRGGGGFNPASRLARPQFSGGYDGGYGYTQPVYDPGY